MGALASECSVWVRKAELSNAFMYVAYFIGFTGDKPLGLCVIFSMTPPFLFKKTQQATHEWGLFKNIYTYFYLTLTDRHTRLLKCQNSSLLVDKNLAFLSFPLSVPSALTSLPWFWDTLPSSTRDSGSFSASVLSAWSAPDPADYSHLVLKITHLASFVSHDILRINPCCCKWQHLICSCGWVVFHCTYVPNLIK